MARASKHDPLPNAPLELSDPIALPAGEVPGAELLRELSPEHAALLFDVLRVATAWAADGGASGWYDTAMLRGWEEAVLTADLDEPLRSAVAVLLGELVDPASADPGRLAMCCLQISEWTLDRGAESTSLTFSRAAAQMQPTNARLAYIVGRRYRTACRFRDADLWLRRSARVALWYSDWDTYARALNSLGILAYRQGSFPRARKYLDRALRISERHGLRKLQGEIYHDRFTVALASGEADVEEFARAAYDCYLPGHERLPALAYDIGYHWLLKGHAARALSVFQAVLPRLTEPGECFQVMAGCARAAGALGNRALFQEIWSNAVTVLGKTHNRSGCAAALLDLGYGAGHLGDWNLAESAFSQAEEVARTSGQGEDRLLAEDALAAVARLENPDPLKLPFVQAGSTDFSRRIAFHLGERESGRTDGRGERGATPDPED